MSKSRKRSTGPRRDAFDIATDLSVLSVSAPLRSSRSLSEIEDRRQFHPGVRQPRALRQVARISLLPSRRSLKTRSPLSAKTHTWQFNTPQTVMLCVRRAVRKQVMHAKRKAGKKVRRPRRNRLSSISCRRS